MRVNKAVTGLVWPRRYGVKWQRNLAFMPMKEWSVTIAGRSLHCTPRMIKWASGGGVYPFLDRLCLLAPLAYERNNAMKDIHIDQREEEILTVQISDEALEAAAGSVKEKAGAFTLAFCSGLDSCPS
jgi:hypothetical protein